MRRLFVVAAFVMALPSASTAAPLCVSGTLSSYIALGAGGCEVGGGLFSDFSSAASLSGGVEIDAASILVSPFDLGLDFSLAASAGAGEVTGVLINYRLDGPSIGSSTLSMNGTSVTPDGVAFVVEDICAGALFDPFLVCATPQSLIVVDDGFGAFPNDSKTFSPETFFDVFVDITLDGGLTGSAAIDGKVRTAFGAATPVPEPSALLLVGSGLLGLLARRRRTPH